MSSNDSTGLFTKKCNCKVFFLLKACFVCMKRNNDDEEGNVDCGFCVDPLLVSGEIKIVAHFGRCKSM